MKFIYTTCVVLLVVSLVGIPLAPVIPSNLHDVVNTPANSYEVWYTDDNPPPASDSHYVPAIQAQRAANALDNSNTPSTYDHGRLGWGLPQAAMGRTIAIAVGGEAPKSGKNRSFCRRLNIHGAPDVALRHHCAALHRIAPHWCRSRYTR